MKKIELTFKNSLTRISGNDFGAVVYKKQVKPNITGEDEKYEIIFPEHIKGVGISFVKGFTSDLVMTYGIEGMLERFSFVSVHESVRESIHDSIYF